MARPWCGGAAQRKASTVICLQVRVAWAGPRVDRSSGTPPSSAPPLGNTDLPVGLLEVHQGSWLGLRHLSIGAITPSPGTRRCPGALAQMWLLGLCSTGWRPLPGSTRFRQPVNHGSSVALNRKPQGPQGHLEPGAWHRGLEQGLPGLPSSVRLRALRPGLTQC